MTTLAKIAKAAGVTPAVVSRIINNDQSLRVGKDTRRRIENLIKELEYAPNIAARSLRSAKSGIIAMVMHDISNLVYSEIMRGAQEAASEAGYSILLSDASSNTRSSSRLADMIGGGGVDGVILQADGGNSDNVLLRAARQKVSTVLLQAELDVKAHLISLPDKQATKIATQHLIGLGHKNIGCVGTVKGLTFTTNRILGWKEAMLNANLECSSNRVTYSSPAIEEGMIATSDLLDRNPDMTAIVYCNTLTAVGAIEAIEQRNLRVPEDLSIVSVHDIKLANFLRVPLTTISMPLFEMGQHAVDLVRNNETDPNGVTYLDHLTPKLIIRGSTGQVSQK